MIKPVYDLFVVAHFYTCQMSFFGGTCTRTCHLSTVEKWH